MQFKHYRWSRDPILRRMSFVVSLHFLLPGVMSVVSLLSEQAQLIWNVAFALSGLCGVIATGFAAVGSSSGSEKGPQYELFTQGVAIALYALITILAIFPNLPSAFGLDVTPLLIEAILITLLAILGSTMAWFLFMEPEQ